MTHFNPTMENVTMESVSMEKDVVPLYLIKSSHGDLEASSFADEDILLLDDNVFKGDAASVGSTLTHVLFLPEIIFFITVVISNE